MAEQSTLFNPAMPSRREIESTLEILIDLLDQMDPDPDIEEENEHGDGSLTGVGVDDEPSLGSTDAINHERAWKVVGRDLEYDGDTVADADAEPWLGSHGTYGPIDQERWAIGARDACEEDDERELDEDGEPDMGATTEIDQETAWQHSWEAGCGCAEPCLGAPEAIDQTHWNQGTGNEEEEPMLGSSVIGNQEHWGASSVDPETDECEREEDKDDADENEPPPCHDPVRLHRTNAEGPKVARMQLRALRANRRGSPRKHSHRIEA